MGMNHKIFYLFSTFLFVLYSCENKSVPSQALTETNNRKPEILEIICNPKTSSINRLQIGGQDTLRVVAIDPDGDILSYKWSCMEGSFLNGNSDSTVIWQSPTINTKEEYLINVIVSDSQLYTIDSVKVYVDSLLVLSQDMIVYLSDRGIDDIAMLYSIELSTYEIKSIIENPAMHIDISRDQTKIVFKSGNDICIVNVDGSEYHSIISGHMLDPPGSLTFPQFSPNGFDVFFSYRYAPDWQHIINRIYLINIDGSNLRQYCCWVNDYSPNGDFAIDNGLYIFPIDSPSLGRQLPIRGYQPQFVSDSKIVYCYNGDIYAIGTDGNNNINLTNSGDMNGSEPPVVSPDGNKILFKSKDKNRLFEYNFSENNMKVIIDRLGFMWTQPSYSPDGKLIAIAIKSDIYLMDSDGSVFLNLTRDAYAGSDDYNPIFIKKK